MFLHYLSFIHPDCFASFPVFCPPFTSFVLFQTSLPLFSISPKSLLYSLTLSFFLTSFHIIFTVTFFTNIVSCAMLPFAYLYLLFFNPSSIPFWLSLHPSITHSLPLRYKLTMASDRAKPTSKRVTPCLPAIGGSVDPDTQIWGQKQKNTNTERQMR